ncbi:metallophosphoesterase [Ulvibacterium marinum]|uniref:metallophosphoesterase n=1 Tax=Ulvibacterium marinum TaxID=2419782 RepID=UPI002493DA89|nr:metallophosphoesterase [Ulvibacterium marinum]
MTRTLLFMLPWFFLIGCSQKKKTSTKFPEFEIGVVADCQYCNCKSGNQRFYRQSPMRLKEAIDTLNTYPLDYSIHLGDFIDQSFDSFDTVAPIWATLKSDRFHVLGNHDFSVADSLKPYVFEKMELNDRYYSIVRNKWRFIILDGNDLSLHGALSESKKQQTDSLFNLLEGKNLPNVVPWNGGLSNDQLNWVEDQLKLATMNEERVGMFCHFPTLGVSNAHNLLNYEELLSLIEENDCVKFYFNGHNHAGDYIEKDGVHYLTFKGMVDTQDSTSFARVAFKKDSIFVTGYGRELSRKFKINSRP